MFFGWHAVNIAENILSLGRFADVGLDIYLDDSVLYVFNKESGSLILYSRQKF